MRSLLALLLTASAAAASWEFRADPVCTLSHDGAEVAVEVTWDPRRSEAYAITLTREAPWPAGPVFALRFEGPRGLTISTDRHALGQGGRSLTVTDRGFGNVLNGLEGNGRAVALTGPAAVPFSLDGAAPEVAAFRACADGGIV